MLGEVVAFGVLGFRSSPQATISVRLEAVELSSHLYKRSIPMPPERTRHQEKIIKNYYRNLDAIASQKAHEQVTELYLTEGKKRETVWKRLVGHLEKMGMPQPQIDHLRERDDPTLVVEALKKFT